MVWAFAFLLKQNGLAVRLEFLVFRMWVGPCFLNFDFSTQFSQNEETEIISKAGKEKYDYVCELYVHNLTIKTQKVIFDYMYFFWCILI